MAAAPGERLTRLWSRLAPLPGGSWLFSRVLGLMVPYTGTIHPHIRKLSPGYCLATLRDRRAVRNHLSSIHAVALVNLGEVSSGLAMLTAIPPGVRGIVTNLSAEFLKKARGVVTAECRCEAPSQVSSAMEQLVLAQVTDGSGDVVCRVRVTWLLSPPA